MKRRCIRFGRPSCRTWGARPDGRMISGILSRASLRRSAVGLSLRDARPAVCAQTACLSDPGRDHMAQEITEGDVMVNETRRRGHARPPSDFDVPPDQAAPSSLRYRYEVARLTPRYLAMSLPVCPSAFIRLAVADTLGWAPHAEPRPDERVPGQVLRHGKQALMTSSSGLRPRAALAESARMRNRSARGHPQINREVTDVRLLAHHNLAQLGERFVQRLHRVHVAGHDRDADVEPVAPVAG